MSDVHNITSFDGVGSSRHDGVALSVGAYAKTIGKSLRQVQRWLAAGELPDAVQDGEGRWWIPPHARRVVGAVERAGTGAVELARPDDGPQLGQLVPLDVAAARLDTTVGGVRRMADDGIVRIGPYGPNGALRVFLPPA
jgi:hypothetical protein